MTGPRICRASIAVTSDGSLVANVHNYAGEKDPATLLRRAIELGGEVFVGVVLRDREARDVRSRVDNAGHEGAGAAFVRRRRKRKAWKDDIALAEPSIFTSDSKSHQYAGVMFGFAIVNGFLGIHSLTTEGPMESALHAYEQSTGRVAPSKQTWLTHLTLASRPVAPRPPWA